jgi:hypothetical protein
MRSTNDTLEFGRPPAWAYPTIGSLHDTNTPLPQWIRVVVLGRVNRCIDIDEMLTLNDDEQTHKQIVEAALIQAGDYDIEDFVEERVTIVDGRANVVGYIVWEERINEAVHTWSDDSDEDILDSFVRNRLNLYGDYELTLRR